MNEYIPKQIRRGVLLIVKDSKIDGAGLIFLLFEIYEKDENHY